MWTRPNRDIKTASLKGLIISGLSDLNAGAHANCKRAEFSTRTAKLREKIEGGGSEWEEGSGEKRRAGRGKNK